MCIQKEILWTVQEMKFTKSLSSLLRPKHRRFITLHYNICALSIPALSILLCMITLGWAAWQALIRNTESQILKFTNFKSPNSLHDLFVGQEEQCTSWAMTFVKLLWWSLHRYCRCFLWLYVCDQICKNGSYTCNYK